MTKNWHKWRDECVLFLDDCFSNDSAVEKLRPHFKVVPFHEEFPHQQARGREQGVKDPSIIRLCHENGWLLVTMDHEMRHTHIEEIKAHPKITILATSRNAGTPDDWIKALIELKPRILREFKNQSRPWFATFTRDGNIASFHLISESDTTRRTRKK